MARKIWVKMGFLFLYGLIADSMWRAMRWICDYKPTAVIDTLKHVFQLEKHEMVAVHASIWYETRPVPQSGNTSGGGTLEGASGTNWPRSGPVRKTGRVKEENIMHWKTQTNRYLGA